MCSLLPCRVCLNVVPYVQAYALDVPYTVSDTVTPRRLARPPTPFYTRDTVAREVTATHAPSTVPTSALSVVCEHPSVHSDVEHVTDIVYDVHVRPTAHTFGDVPGPRSAAHRGRSRSPTRRSPHVRYPAGNVITAQSPPPVPPSMPTLIIRRYLSSDDESSTSSASTLPPAQQDPPPPSVRHRSSSRTSRSTVETSTDTLDLARQLAGTVQDQLQKRDDARDRQQRAMDRELRQ